MRDLFWFSGISVVLAATGIKSSTVLQGIWSPDIRALDLSIALGLAIAIASVAPTLLSQSPAKNSQSSSLRITAPFFLGFAICVFVIIAFFSTLMSRADESIFLKLASFVLTLLLVGMTVKRRWTSHTRLARDLRFIFWVLVAVCVGPLVGQAFGLWSTFGPWSRYWGLFNPTLTACLATMGFLLGIILAISEKQNPKKRAVIYIFSGALALVMFMTDTRAGMLASATGVVLIVVLHWRAWKIWLPLLFSTLLLSVFALWIRGLQSLEYLSAINPNASSATSSVSPVAPNDINPLTSIAQIPVRDTGVDMSSGRFTIWNLFIQSWKEQPIVGYGFRSAPELGIGFETHSTPLTILVETGVLGFLVFLIALAGIFAVGKVNSLLPLFVAMIILSLFETLFFGVGGFGPLVELLLVGAFVAAGTKVEGDSLFSVHEVIYAKQN